MEFHSSLHVCEQHFQIPMTKVTAYALFFINLSHELDHSVQTVTSFCFTERLDAHVWLSLIALFHTSAEFASLMIPNGRQQCKILIVGGLQHYNTYVQRNFKCQSLNLLSQFYLVEFTTN